jgi:hypothetical protein
LLDSVPHPGHHRRLLPDVHQRSHLHVLLLRLLPQQSHQPFLLRGFQSTVHERVQENHEGRSQYEVNKREILKLWLCK